MRHVVPGSSILFVIVLAAIGCDDGRNGDSADAAAGEDAGVIPDTGTAADSGAVDAGPQDSGPVYPTCGSYVYSWQGLIPGKNDPGFDADLDRLSRAYDRCWTIFNAAPFGMNADATVRKSNPEKRDLITRFIAETDAWDFKAFSGKEPAEVIDGWGDSVGMYGGAGAAADAYRYAVLRDRGEDCAEIERARGHLLPVLDALHMATDITGVPGVIARAIIRRDLPGNDTREPVPLFDEQGNPLPAEKNNGTLRADNSGRYPDWMWNDSCSRDMLVGWAQAYAAVWEVIGDDPSFDQALKDRLREDARQIGLSLSTVRESGYDLEIRDADGRMTYHGVLNENSVDRSYVEGAENGFYAIMALGIVSAFAFTAGDPELDDYAKKTLVRKRRLHLLARDAMKWVDMGTFSNFSNYNMAFTGAWLALRYTPDEQARAVVAEATQKALYDVPNSDRQPIEMKQSWFDVIFAYSMTGGSVFGPPAAPPDEAALARGIETLKEFKFPPFWDEPVENCDPDEIASGICTLGDGTPVKLLGNVGWNDDLVADKPIPMRARPASNYYWRSNPYKPNGEGGGEGLLPGVDFRVAYWTGRWARR